MLIHGTGAGHRRGDGDGLAPHWWQAESDFAVDLLQRLARQADKTLELAEPFRWGDGGANSELVRRTAGIALEEQLRKWGNAGQRYYLIGHSHGGSVIWHALTHSVAGRKEPLKGLEGWATIGTPYLTFRPDPLSLWPLLPLAVAGYGGWQIWQANPGLDLSLQRALSFGSQPWLLLLLAAICVTLAGVVLWGIFAGLSFLPSLQGAFARNMAQRKAAAEYRDRGLVLFHPDDEPINGLGASLSEPGEIVPRPNIDPRQPLWRRILARLRIVAAKAYGPPLDQFAWDILARGIQGDDLARERMVAAAPLPQHIGAIVGGFSTSETNLYVTEADKGAAATLRKGRELLRNIATGRLPKLTLNDVSQVIDWGGIIHTSYFDHAPTREALTNWMISPKSNLPSAGVSAPQAWRSRGPWLIILVQTAIACGFAGGLWAIAGLMTANLIYPYSTHSIVERIGLQYSDPLLASVRNSDLPGQLLIKLDSMPVFGQLDVIDFSDRALADLPDLNTRFRSATVYVEWSVSHALGDLSVGDAFIDAYQEINAAENSPYHDLERKLLRLYALDAVVGDNRNAAYVEDHVTRYRELSQELGAGTILASRAIDLAVAVGVGYTLDLTEEAAPFVTQLAAAGYGCDRARVVALAMLQEGETDTAGALVNDCSPDLMAGAVVWLAANMRAEDPPAALAALLDRVGDEDGRAMQTTVPTSNGEAPSNRDIEVPLMRSMLLDIAALQQKGDLIRALRSVDQMYAIPWKTTGGLYLANAKAWTLIAAGFVGNGDEETEGFRASLTMLEKLAGDYRTIAMGRDARNVAAAEARDLVWLLLTIEDDTLSLAQEWEALAAPGGAQVNRRAAALTMAGVAYGALRALGLVDEEKVRSIFGAALDAIPRLRDDPAGYALVIAEEVRNFDDGPLLDRALRVATDEAIKAPDFDTRAEYLRRVATMHIERGNFPGALRLIEAAGLPKERFLSLIATTGVIFGELASEETSEFGWTPDLMYVATTWLEHPDGPYFN